MEHISRNAMKSRVMETGQKMIVTTAISWRKYAGNWRGMKILALWKKSGMRWRDSGQRSQKQKYCVEILSGGVQTAEKIIQCWIQRKDLIFAIIAARSWIGVRKMNDRKLKFCPDLTQVVWEKAMMVGHGDYQRIQLNECIKEQCAAYCEDDGKCHKYMNDVEMEE